MYPWFRDGREHFGFLGGSRTRRLKNSSRFYSLSRELSDINSKGPKYRRGYTRYARKTRRPVATIRGRADNINSWLSSRSRDKTPVATFFIRLSLSAARKCRSSCYSDRVRETRPRLLCVSLSFFNDQPGGSTIAVFRPAPGYRKRSLYDGFRLLGGVSDYERLNRRAGCFDRQ